jgi:tetratricopeptide (TPR) repeat protein
MSLPAARLLQVSSEEQQRKAQCHARAKKSANLLQAFPFFLAFGAVRLDNARIGPKDAKALEAGRTGIWRRYMTGRHESPIGLARLGAVACGLLLALAGCQEGITRKTAVDPTGSVPSDKTEAQLLSEINEKFENPPAHYELGRLYHKSQQWTKAEYHYNVALGFDPAFRAAQAGLVKAFVDQGQTPKAEQYANTYLRQAVSNSEREVLRLAWEFEEVELDDYAQRCFGKALELAPDSYEAYKQVGFFYLSKGDNDNAKKYLGRSFELNPRQSDVAGALGRLGVVVEAPQMPEMTMEKEK